MERDSRIEANASQGFWRRATTMDGMSCLFAFGTSPASTVQTDRLPGDELPALLNAVAVPILYDDMISKNGFGGSAGETCAAL